MRYNKDFYQNEVELCKRYKKNKTIAPICEHGNLSNLDFHMYQSLLQNALQPSTGFHEAESNAIETQSEKKRKKHFLKSVSKMPPRNTPKKIIIATCLNWQLVSKTCAQIDNKLRQITSISMRIEAMKEKIRIRVLGLGWEVCHHPWSAAGHEFTGKELAEYIKKLIKRDKERNISSKLPVDMTTSKKSLCWVQYPRITSDWMQKTTEDRKLIEAAEVLKNS